MDADQLKTMGDALLALREHVGEQIDHDGRQVLEIILEAADRIGVLEHLRRRIQRTGEPCGNEASCIRIAELTEQNRILEKQRNEALDALASQRPGSDLHHALVRLHELELKLAAK